MHWRVIVLERKRERTWRTAVRLLLSVQYPCRQCCIWGWGPGKQHRCIVWRLHAGGGLLRFVYESLNSKSSICVQWILPMHSRRIWTALLAAS